MKTILSLVVGLMVYVVVGVNTFAQRVYLPTGTNSVTRAVIETSTFLTVGLVGPIGDTNRQLASSDVQFRLAGLGVDIPTEVGRVMSELANGLETWHLDTKRYNYRVKVGSGYIRPGDKCKINVNMSGWVLDENGDATATFEADLPYESRLYATGSSTDKDLHFTAEPSPDGTWAFPTNLLDKVPASYFYGGQPRSSSLLAVKVGVDRVKWVQEQSFGEGWGSLNDGYITRNGFPVNCVAGSPKEAGGRWGNGWVYLPVHLLMGTSVAAEFEPILHWDELDPYDTDGMHKPLWIRERITLWYDEGRTEGDEWTVQADESGVSFNWRPIGYIATKVAVEGGELRVRYSGLEPGKSYGVVPVASIAGDSVQGTPVSVVVGDAQGRGEVRIDVDKRAPARFLMLRPSP